MPRFLVDLLAQFRGVWTRLDGGQRWLMVSVLALTLVGLGGMMWVAGQPDYQLVVEAVDPREVSSAVRALSQAGIPFSRDGRGIAVPRSLVPEARSVLFESGVTASAGGGSESDDLMTRFTLDRDARKDLLDAKNRSRAERAVLQIEGVLSATVTSSMPKRSIYQSLDSETEPRASVLVRVRAGASFRRIAAAAVETACAALGVAPEHVVVVNTSTQERYSIDSRTGSTVDTTEFLSLQRARSDELTDRAQAVLDRLYPDQARVQVVVELDPNWETRQEKIVPDAPILVSDKTTKTDSTESSSSVGGDPSASTQAAEASGPRNNKKDSTSEKSYEPFRGTSNKGKLAPDVRRLSVALVLDEKLQLAAEKLSNVENLIKQCVGFTADRDGFAIHVEKLPELKVEPPPSGPGTLEALKDYVPTIAQVVGVVIVLLFLRGMLRRAVEKPSAAVASVEEEVPEESLSPEESIRRMRRDIEKAITEDPAAVSRMLEGWLTEVKS
ncbi:MAG: flagellar M-ring protein FliF C-terminal domain-containing protein [Planctomycetota bacterium]